MVLFHAGASGDSSPSHAFLRRDIRWLLAPRGAHIALNKWESGVLYTRQPVMWGWYCVNKRPVPSKHGSCWCGAGIMWMRGCPLHTAAADVGLVSCEWEGILYTLSSRICPRLSAPPWKGDMRSRADILSCRFDGWEECGHLVGMSSSPESLRSTADQG